MAQSRRGGHDNVDRPLSLTLLSGSGVLIGLAMEFW
jgi:hypothetical protein